MAQHVNVTAQPLDPQCTFTSSASPSWGEVTIADFWQWAYSDIMDNTARGRLAEFIVARAVNATDVTARGWLPYDLEQASGVKIEVKSSAYVQGWYQSKPSRITWSIEPTLAWDPATNEFNGERTRHADVYVFSLITEKDATGFDPMNLDQWAFYVVPRRRIDERFGAQKSIGITAVQSLSSIYTVANLKNAVESAGR